MTTTDNPTKSGQPTTYDEQLQADGIRTDSKSLEQFIVWAKLKGIKVITEVNREEVNQSND